MVLRRKMKKLTVQEIVIQFVEDLPDAYISRVAEGEGSPLVWGRSASDETSSAGGVG